MATLDIASKGAPSLVYSSSILAAFLRKLQVLPDAPTALHKKPNLGGNNVVTLTLVDGSTFHDWSLLNHLAKLASEAAGSPTFDIVSLLLDRHYFVAKT